MAAQKRDRHLVDAYRELSTYRISQTFVVAADYRVAQTRQRFLTVGFREDIECGVRHPSPTTPMPAWPILREALSSGTFQSRWTIRSTGTTPTTSPASQGHVSEH